MGIERFFSSIIENSITKGEDGFIVNKKLKVNNIYFDFNSEIHNVSNLYISDLNREIKEKIDKNEKINELSEKELDKKIIHKIKNKLIYLIDNFTEKDNLKQIYLAIDGVPTLGKIMEQRRRRYLGYVIQEIKKEIFKKYKKKLSKKKLKYIDSKVSFDKSKISPATKFMYELSKELKSFTFRNKINSIFNNVNKYIVSDYNEYGEGEMKIFWNCEDNSVIVSPDSDVTLLGLLLTNNKKNIYILRHNQQKSIYEMIDVNKLRENLINYISKKIIIKNTNYNRIIKDIVILFTFFGNDFIQKVRSIDVKSGFEEIINLYINSYNKKGYLINEKSINLVCFSEILLKLSNIEKKSLQKKYIMENYKNYYYLKSILEIKNNFIEIIKQFLEDLKRLHKILNKHKGKVYLKSIQFKTNKFIYKMRKLVKMGGMFKTDEDFIKKYYEYKKKNKKYPELNIKFRRHTNTFDEYHEKKLKEINPDYTEYDLEIYKLENMLGDYRSMLGYKEIDLGKVFIENYEFKEIPFNKSIKNYYKGHKKNKMCEEFIKGIIFTFKHYVLSNKFVPVMWFYKYSKAPLISDIYDYVIKNKDKINTMTINIPKKYFNSVQHLSYISPNEEIKPEEFRKELNKKVKEKIRKSIDCNEQIFLAKCFIETYPEKPNEFINKTNKIKKSQKTKELLGFYESKNSEDNLYPIIDMNNFSSRYDI